MEVVNAAFHAKVK